MFVYNVFSTTDLFDENICIKILLALYGAHNLILLYSYILNVHKILIVFIELNIKTYASFVYDSEKTILG